jgi:hypothetical protein
MRRLFTAFGSREVLAMLGLGMIAAGLAMVSVPAALVVTGTLLFGLATLPLMRRGESSE